MFELLTVAPFATAAVLLHWYIRGFFIVAVVYLFHHVYLLVDISYRLGVQQALKCSSCTSFVFVSCTAVGTRREFATTGGRGHFAGRLRAVVGVSRAATWTMSQLHVEVKRRLQARTMHSVSFPTIRARVPVVQQQPHLDRNIESQQNLAHTEHCHRCLSPAVSAVRSVLIGRYGARLQ